MTPSEILVVQEIIEEEKAKAKLAHKRSKQARAFHEKRFKALEKLFKEWNHYETAIQQSN